MNSRRRLADHRDRNVAEAGVLREHGEEGLDHARRKAVAEHDAVDVARVEMLGGALDAERAQHLHALAHRHAELGIERPAARRSARWRRRARRRSAATAAVRHARRKSRCGGAPSHARRARAWPIAAARSAARPAARHRPASAIGKGGILVAVDARDDRNDRPVGGGDLAGRALRAADSFCGGARLGDDHGGGLDRAKAAGASAHVVSTIGKAPAAASASTKSVAGLSATRIIGPCSDMGAHAGYKMKRHKR